MAAARAERRLAAILAADIVGYSRLIEQDETATLEAIKNVRREVLDPLLAEHHGRIVKLMGDGAIVEFGSVVDAVACAVAIQKGVGDRQAEIAPERRIIFRIGVNLGDVVVEGEDLLGDGVNIAARLEQLCPPGGVLISGTAYDHMKGKFNLPLEYTGEQQVKNISQPVRTYSVRMDGVKPGWSLHARRFRRSLPMAAALLAVLLIAAVGVWWFQPVDAPAGKPSVAVLPFANLGGDDATGRLADGITEDIITDLATFPEFDVVARNSIETYKGKAVDVREVSNHLGVGYVLEGSIQRQGEQVRITAQLIDGNNGNHVWSERWDRPASDVFAIQTEIAEQVTNRLGGGAGLIQTAGREAARRKRPDNLTAYEFYLLGTEKLEQMTAADNQEAIRLLNRAVDLDPGLARAWIELSHAHNQSTSFGADRAAAQKAAMAAAERAVMLDPNDAEAHVALGARLGENGDFTRAKAAFERALRLSPNSAEILTFYAGWASTFGEPERGAEIVDRVIRLNPDYPMWAAGPFSYAYFMAGRYEDAAGLLERVPPDHYNMNRWAFRAGSYAALGRAEQAKATVKQALERLSGSYHRGLRQRSGWSEAERQRLIETMRPRGSRPAPSRSNLRSSLSPSACQNAGSHQRWAGRGFGANACLNAPRLRPGTEPLIRKRRYAWARWWWIRPASARRSTLPPMKKTPRPSPRWRGRVDLEGDADALGQRRRGHHQRGVEAEADRAAGDLEHVDDPAGEARPRRVERGDRGRGDRRVEQPDADAEHDHARHQVAVRGLRRRPATAGRCRRRGTPRRRRRSASARAGCRAARR